MVEPLAQVQCVTADTSSRLIRRRIGVDHDTVIFATIAEQQRAVATIIRHYFAYSLPNCTIAERRSATVGLGVDDERAPIRVRIEALRHASTLT